VGNDIRGGKQTNIRLSTQLLARVDACRASKGMTRNEWMVKALAAQVTAETVAPSTPAQEEL